MQAYDVIVIGAGPAGIFTALELDKLLQDLPHHERLGRRRRVF